MAEQSTPTRQQTRQTQNTRKKKKKVKIAREPWKVWGFRIYMVICFAVAIGIGVTVLQFWIPDDAETYVQRIETRPLLEETVLANANTQLLTLGNVKVDQRGPVFYFDIEISAETDAQTAKDLAWQAMQTFVSAIGDNPSEEQPLGSTFITYEAQIVINQTGLVTPEDQVYKDPNTEEGDNLFPIFGSVNHVNSQTINWSNNE
ncbi:MAG: hypothetical protein ACRC5Q_07670 [Culicoidibacterales bacterium]